MSDLREKIARVIEPRAFGSAMIHPKFEAIHQMALAKADAIIALLPPAPDGATEGWRIGAGGARRAAFSHLGSYSASEEAAPSGATASWRDIESAPKDGTPVDLWVEIVEEAPNTFHLENEAHRVPNTYYADYRWFGGEWPWRPTHWMPLPNPPASASPLGEGTPGADATYADNPSSQPPQTGEENAGLVERANEALIAEARHMARHAIGTRGIKALFNRLADALTSRSPIPGETPETINAWALETFGPISGSASVAARANKEMAELLTKCIEGAPDAEIAEETADVVIVLYRMMAVLGFDLFGAINRKMAVNRTRRWVIKNGHGQHIEGPPIAEGGEGG